jgi:hypothetical protein
MISLHSSILPVDRNFISPEGIQKFSLEKEKYPSLVSDRPVIPRWVPNLFRLLVTQFAAIVTMFRFLQLEVAV